MLARTFEAAGLPTILVTMMPYWAEKVGAPRTLAVEFPFGHTLGPAQEHGQQRRVILEALQVLAEADRPGTIVHSQERWHEPAEIAREAWQPSQPSPVVEYLGPKIKDMLRDLRKRNS